MSKIRFAFVCGLVLVAYLIGSLFRGWESERQQQQELLSKLRAVVEMKQQRTDEEVVLRLKDHTSFEWDRMYIFSPYTSMKQIDQALGYTWPRARTTGIDMSDRFFLMVFTSAGRVVGYLRYPTEMGSTIDNYGIDRELKGFSPEEAVFMVEIEDGGVILRRLDNDVVPATAQSE